MRKRKRQAVKKLIQCAAVIAAGVLAIILFMLAIWYRGKRTKVYYCHPYSSWERGTNEVTNKMIRRKIPKGTNFDDRTEEEVESIENWINGYPRKIHGYHSAGELFEEEVKQLA